MPASDAYLAAARAVKAHAEGCARCHEGVRNAERSCNSSMLFPEHMRGDLREVRATIEMHSRRVPLVLEPGAAAGLCVRPGNRETVRVRAHTPGGILEHVVDRWD